MSEDTDLLFQVNPLSMKILMSLSKSQNLPNGPARSMYLIGFVSCASWAGSAFLRDCSCLSKDIMNFGRGPETFSAFVIFQIHAAVSGSSVRGSLGTAFIKEARTVLRNSCGIVESDGM